jgi:hypothetical protein
MKNFKLISRVSFTLVVFAALVFAGCATVPNKPGAVVVDEITHTSTVVKIDSAKRVVTLKQEDGSTQSYVLGDNVKNFDQIKVGDTVKSTVYESVAIFVRKSNEEPDATVSKSVSLAPKGDKPGITMTDTFELVARVSAIDLNKGTITLQSPDGTTKMFAIDKSVDNFKNIKAGDDVVLNVTAGVIIAVEAPAPAAPPTIK